ncbi:uncharacterized protein HKW66_Vig0253520 [Vigna angularis]|uniref:Uncharacterized protein n=2 Tax=Phaseolus angularis TaxID=3914 RepID=A0A8T0K0X8_PHAAN|nr:uncharacterized protein HKW66_Vig0253520 [Vigna angularis]
MRWCATETKYMTWSKKPLLTATVITYRTTAVASGGFFPGEERDNGALAAVAHSRCDLVVYLSRDLVSSVVLHRNGCPMMLQGGSCGVSRFVGVTAMAGDLGNVLMDKEQGRKQQGLRQLLPLSEIAPSFQGPKELLPWPLSRSETGSSSVCELATFSILKQLGQNLKHDLKLLGQCLKRDLKHHAQTLKHYAQTLKHYLVEGVKEGMKLLDEGLKYLVIGLIHLKELLERLGEGLKYHLVECLKDVKEDLELDRLKRREEREHMERVKRLKHLKRLERERLERERQHHLGKGVKEGMKHERVNEGLKHDRQERFERQKRQERLKCVERECLKRLEHMERERQERLEREERQQRGRSEEVEKQQSRSTVETATSSTSTATPSASIATPSELPVPQLPPSCNCLRCNSIRCNCLDCNCSCCNCLHCNCIRCNCNYHCDWSETPW